MSNFRFINRTLPQTLLVASYLIYITVIFDILFGRVREPIFLAVSLGLFVGVLGFVNERKFGYIVAVASAGINMLVEAVIVVAVSPAYILSLIFAIALFALLVHPQSREHQRIWFR